VRQAGATYSVVAVDTATRQVGGAGTSCMREIEGADVYIIYGSVPGRGVVHAQALVSGLSRDRAIKLLAGGTAPVDIIAAITAASFDGSASMRQYAVADLGGRVAAHTGTQTQAYAGDRQGMPATFVYSVQGNILTGKAVLTQAAAAFEGGGCDLAERLMRALEGGALGGEGDRRCTPLGIPSDSAFVQVDREGEPAGSYLALRVPSSGNDDPLVELRASFDTWRETHPCEVALSPEAPAEDAGCGCRTTPGRLTPLAAFWGIVVFGVALSRRSSRRWSHPRST
jgi:MYXO-CTERM domain-containing protein